MRAETVFHPPPAQRAFHTPRTPGAPSLRPAWRAGFAWLLATALALLPCLAWGGDPVVRIQGAEETRTLTLSTQAVDARLDVLLVWAEGEAEVVVVDADVTSAVPTQGGPAVPVSLSLAGVDGAPPSNSLRVDLSRDRIRAVRLTAHLSEAAEFTSLLSLSVNGGLPSSYTVRIQRTATTDDVDLAVLQPPVFSLPLAPGGTTARIHLQVMERQGAATWVRPPALHGLTRAGSGGGTAGPDFVSAGLCTPPSDEGGPEGALHLLGSATRDLDLCITGLQEPGTYTGQVRLATLSGQEVLEGLTFNVRDPWVVCAFFILVGALVSMAVNQWQTSGRERVLTEIRLRRAIDEVETHLPLPRDRAVRDALVTLLKSLHEDRRLGGLTEAEVQSAAEAVIQKKRQYQAVAAVRALEDQLPDLVPDEMDRARLASRFRALDDALHAEGLDGLAPVGAEPAPLARRAADLRREVLLASLDGVRQALLGIRARLPEPSADPSDPSPQAALRHRVDRVLATVEEAQKAPDIADIRDLVVALREIRTAWEALPTRRSRSTRLAQEMPAFRSEPSATAEAAPPFAGEDTGSLVLPASLDLLAPPRPGAVPEARVRPVPSLLRRLAVSDKASWFATLAVSVLVGLQVLWLNRLDWGGLADFIYAFLWGFGLDVVGKGALEKLRARLPDDAVTARPGPR